MIVTVGVNGDGSSLSKHCKLYALLCFPLVKAIINIDNKYLGYVNFLLFIMRSLNPNFFQTLLEMFYTPRHKN